MEALTIRQKYLLAGAMGGVAAGGCSEASVSTCVLALRLLAPENESLAREVDRLCGLLREANRRVETAQDAFNEIFFGGLTVPEAISLRAGEPREGSEKLREEQRFRDDCIKRLAEPREHIHATITTLQAQISTADQMYLARQESEGTA